MGNELTPEEQVMVRDAAAGTGLRAYYEITADHVAAAQRLFREGLVEWDQIGRRIRVTLTFRGQLAARGVGPEPAPEPGVATVHLPGRLLAALRRGPKTYLQLVELGRGFTPIEITRAVMALESRAQAGLEGARLDRFQRAYVLVPEAGAPAAPPPAAPAPRPELRRALARPLPRRDPGELDVAMLRAGEGRDR